MKKTMKFFLAVIVLMFAAAISFLSVSETKADDTAGDRYGLNINIQEDDTEKSSDTVSLSEYSSDAAFEAEIVGFPEVYRDALRRLHSVYPNMKFQADYIDMTLSEAVELEINKQSIYYGNGYTKDYNTVYKYMNPLTYLYPEYDANYIKYSNFKQYYVNADAFVFADFASTGTEYPAALQYLVDEVDFLENEDMGTIIATSQKYGMNPYALCGISIIEKGTNAISNGNLDVTGRVLNKGTANGAIYSSADTTSQIISTANNETVYIVASYENSDWYMLCYNGYPAYIQKSCVRDISYEGTYYNLFSIGQSDTNVVCGGITYARNHGWTSRAASFEGGAEFCANKYYTTLWGAHQNTYYYMELNVKDPENIWHQYCTTLYWAVSAARWMAYAYEYDPNQSVTLCIPVYKGGSVEWYNGQWTYMYQGMPDYSYTGIASNEYGWWRVVNGIVDFSADGVYQNEYGWWYCQGGKVMFDYTGIKPNEWGWWRIVNGQVDFSADGVYWNEYGWWYCQGGKVMFDYTGIKPNEYGWWRIVDGKVDFSADGVYWNEYGWWYCQGGLVMFDYTGIKPNEYGWWRIVDGKVDFSADGIYQNEWGWWYCQGGKVDFDYTGRYGDWYVYGGCAVR